MKFSHKIILVSSGILLIALSLLSFNQYLFVKERISELIINSVDEISTGVSTTVDSEMRGYGRLAKYSQALIEQDFSPETIKHIIDQPMMHEAFLLVGFGYETTGKHIGNDPGWDPGPTWDARVRPWYIDAKLENDLIVTAPYADSVTKEIVVSLAVPIREQGSFVGAIFYDVSLKQMADTINRVNLFDAGYVFMVASNGTIISHPDPKLNGKSISDFLPESVRIITEKPQRLMVAEQDSEIFFVKVPGQEWFVGVVLDHDKAFSTVTELRNQSLFYSIVALILGVVILMFLIAYLLKPLEDLNQAMSDFSSGNGDLTKRLSTDTDIEFADVATNFNSFATLLQGLISEIKNLGDRVLTDSESTAVSARQSRGVIQEQVAEVEALATAMNQMTATALEVANNAQEASNEVKAVDKATEEGVVNVDASSNQITQLSQQIDGAVTEVMELENNSKEIESIMSVINDIAAQTNLLALNAAIEAARAGESGRGFAVVADEVRNLALRTQKSTTEIHSMIEKLKEGTFAAVQTMNKSKDMANITIEKSREANESLSVIKDSIERISDMNVQIASASEEQSLVSEEINRSTVKVKELAEQVASLAGEVDQTMAVQVENVAQQHKLVNQFRV